MGYTHYWESKGFDPQGWQLFTATARKVINLARADGIAIAGSNGTGTPDLTADEVCFNGRDSDSHETAFISRNAGTHEFCKTARKPYDAVVVALLVYGAELGGLTWSSDGDQPDHEAGYALLGRARKVGQGRETIGTLRAALAVKDDRIDKLQRALGQSTADNLRLQRIAASHALPYARLKRSVRAMVGDLSDIGFGTDEAISGADAVDVVANHFDNLAARSAVDADTGI